MCVKKHTAFNQLNQSNIILAQRAAVSAGHLLSEEHFANTRKPRISPSLSNVIRVANRPCVRKSGEESRSWNEKAGFFPPKEFGTKMLQDHRGMCHRFGGVLTLNLLSLLQDLTYYPYCLKQHSSIPTNLRSEGKQVLLIGAMHGSAGHHTAERQEVMNLSGPPPP